jgi:hypothetical protein
MTAIAVRRLPPEVDSLHIYPADIDTPTALYRRHTLRWSDGTVRAVGPGQIIAAALDVTEVLWPADQEWRFVAADGTAWNVTRSSCGCGGPAVLPRAGG